MTQVLMALADVHEPIRVMRIIARLNVGGPAIHVSLLSADLQDHLFRTILVTGVIGSDEADMGYLARDLGVEPIIIPTLQREISLLKDIRTLKRLIQLMREHKPQIVHTHTAKAGLVGRVAAFIAGVPVVVHTFHGHIFYGYFSRFKSEVFVWLERIEAVFSDMILTISEGLRDDLLHYRIASPQKLRVLPLGLHLDPFTESTKLRGRLREEWNISTDIPLIGIIGRLVRIKNHDLFLRAAAIVRDFLPTAEFIIVGGGECQQELKNLASSLGLANAVHFIGWRHDLPSVYSDLNLVVISSINEGTPVSLIEAMAAGVPVVATAVGGIPDLLCYGNFGALVPPQDVNALAQAIIATLQEYNPERTRSAQTYALEQYGFKRLAQDIRSLYQELLMQKGISLPNIPYST